MRRWICLSGFRRLLATVSAAGAVACNEPLLEPRCDRCNEVRVQTDIQEYATGAQVAFTISNLTSDMLRYDWCSVVAASRRLGGAEEPFDTAHRPSARCGAGAGPAEIAANMRALDAGGSVRDSLMLRPGAIQQEYRVLLWLVAADGTLEAGNPVFSNGFDVTPSGQ